MPDDESPVRHGPQADRTMGTTLIRVTMTGDIAESVLRLIGVVKAVPDFSTLKRQITLAGNIPTGARRGRCALFPTKGTPVSMVARNTAFAMVAWINGATRLTAQDPYRCRRPSLGKSCY
ncbi:MAG: hypothetical protein FJX25_12145 [Alphaproteobacteria bacterium]|nr:hypothetical protein [Alphaproteobacteria bacterium]